MADTVVEAGRLKKRRVVVEDAAMPEAMRLMHNAMRPLIIVFLATRDSGVEVCFLFVHEDLPTAVPGSLLTEKDLWKFLCTADLTGKAIYCDEDWVCADDPIKHALLQRCKAFLEPYFEEGKVLPADRMITFGASNRSLSSGHPGIGIGVVQAMHRISNLVDLSP